METSGNGPVINKEQLNKRYLVRIDTTSSCFRDEMFNIVIKGTFVISPHTIRIISHSVNIIILYTNG